MAELWHDSRVAGGTDPAVRTLVLPNGLRAVLRHNAYPPNRVTAWLEVHAGSLNEGEHERGLAHL
jgi:zinc protease